MAAGMVELGLCIEDAVAGGVDATGRPVARWAEGRPDGWALAYVGSAVWADRGCRLLDRCLPRDVWLPDVAAGLEPGACVVLSALVDGAGRSSDGLAALVVARCDGAVVAAAALASRRDAAFDSGRVRDEAMGWEHVRSVFACAAAVMRRLSEEHESSGAAFVTAMDLPPRG